MSMQKDVPGLPPRPRVALPTQMSGRSTCRSLVSIMFELRSVTGIVEELDD